MLNYEEFKEKVAKEFINHLPISFAGYEVVVNEVRKVNQSLDAITVRDTTQFQQISPSFYINRMYERYEAINDVNRVMDEFANTFVNALREAGEVPDITPEMIRENVVVQLINTLQNEGLLQNSPHREMNDLSEVYRVVLQADKSGMKSFLVTNDIMERLGMDESELNRLALQNTKRILPVTIRSMEEVLFGMITDCGMSEQEGKELVDVIANVNDRSMYVVSNASGLMGASSILYDEYLHPLAEKMGSDLFILPSSIHEVIVVSSKMADPEDLSEMVTEINADQVQLEERLSNQVYLYDKEARTLTLASDTPVKMLDGSDRAERQYSIAEERAAYR